MYLNMKNLFFQNPKENEENMSYGVGYLLLHRVDFMRGCGNLNFFLILNFIIDFFSVDGVYQLFV